jgi:hypothetical protein
MSVAVGVTATSQAQRVVAGQQGSSNVKLVGTVTIPRMTDLEVEQELSRPYAYVSVAGGFHIINMKDPRSAQDEQFDRWLRQDPEHQCFQQSIPRVTPLQATGRISPHTRSYWAKYPGEFGAQRRHLTLELLSRLAPAQGDTLGATSAPRAEGKAKAMWTTWKERRTAAVQ